MSPFEHHHAHTPSVCTTPPLPEPTMWTLSVKVITRANGTTRHPLPGWTTGIQGKLYSLYYKEETNVKA